MLIVLQKKNIQRTIISHQLLKSADTGDSSESLKQTIPHRKPHGVNNFEQSHFFKGYELTAISYFEKKNRI